MTHEELIKERNNLAKQIYSNNPLMNTSYAIVLANTMMTEMYGVNWNDEQTEQPESKDNGNAGYDGHVCENQLIGAEKAVYEFYNSVVEKTKNKYYADTFDIKGWTNDLIQRINEESDALIKQYGYDISIVDNLGVKWIRVQGLGEDFFIAANDINSRGDMTYAEAMLELKKAGLDTFDRKQGFIIATLIEEINAKLREAGGKPFEKELYVSKELWRPVGSSTDLGGTVAWCILGNGGCFGSYTCYYGNFRCRAVLDHNKLKDLHKKKGGEK